MDVDWMAVEIVCSLEFWRMAVLWTLSLLYSYFRLFLLNTILPFFLSHHPPPSYPRYHFSPDPAFKSKRPICIITGATSGLGAAAACALAGEGYHVVLAGRDPQLLSKTIEEIKQQQKGACLNAFQVDVSSIYSIKKFISSIQKWLLDSNLHPSVQLLINNAGILATSCKVTADEYDRMMETNYIGAFALTNLLLPLLKNSPIPSRIVNVTSFTHRCLSNVEVDKETLAGKYLSCLSTSEKYPFAHIYEYSKLCVLLFSYELHRQLYLMDTCCNVSVTSADPGVVETKIMRELPPCLSQLAFTVLRFMRLLQSPETGVGSIIDAALAPPEASGKYFFGGKGRTMKSSMLSYDAKLAQKLWSSSYAVFQEAQCALSEPMEGY